MHGDGESMGVVTEKREWLMPIEKMILSCQLNRHTFIVALKQQRQPFGRLYRLLNIFRACVSFV